MSIIQGKAYWASIITPNTTFDTDGIWSIDVGNLNKKNKKRAEENGLIVKNRGDDRGDFVTIKRRVKRADDTASIPPKIIDAQKNDMSTTRVGNGSLVNVLYYAWEWEFKEHKGVSADLHAVQVINLVPYNCDNEDEAFEVVPEDKTKTKKEKEMTEENSFKIKRGEFGYIYCITNESWKEWVKVGMTTGLKSRIAGFNLCNPTECKVIDYHITDKLHFNEHEVHKHFNKFIKKKKRKEKVSSTNTTSLEWHNVSVAEAKELFTSAIQIIKATHLEEQLGGE